MRCSICFPTFNHRALLENTLASILSQSPPFEFEIVIANDGSTDGTNEILAQCAASNARLKILDMPTKGNWRSPCVAMNVALKAAAGDIVIWQTDDVMHETPHLIENLCDALKPGLFVLAACRCNPEPWTPHGWYIHSVHRRAMHPFLAALWRSDIYAVGGLDERFADGAWFDDDWFEACIINRGISPVWRDDIIGYHQPHEAGHDNDHSKRDRNQRLLRNLVNAGTFYTETAPWPM